MRLHGLRHSSHPSLGEDGKNKEWLSDSPRLQEERGAQERKGWRGEGGREDEGGGVSLHCIACTHSMDTMYGIWSSFLTGRSRKRWR